MLSQEGTMRPAHLSAKTTYDQLMVDIIKKSCGVDPSSADFHSPVGGPMDCVGVDVLRLPKGNQYYATDYLSKKPDMYAQSPHWSVGSFHITRCSGSYFKPGIPPTN